VPRLAAETAAVYRGTRGVSRPGDAAVDSIIGGTARADVACSKAQLAVRCWSVANDSRLTVLRAPPRADPALLREIACKVLASGRASVAVAQLEGRGVVRICAVHGETTIADVDELAEALEAAR
jgi:hypothetical protein